MNRIQAGFTGIRSRMRFRAPDHGPGALSVALVVEKYDRTMLVIDGHTDSIASRSHSMGLSQPRSDTVGRDLAGPANPPGPCGSPGVACGSDKLARNPHRSTP